MILKLADLALVVVLGSTTTLIVVYGILQPWWRSWFGIGMLLTLFAVWQMLARAELTTIFGEKGRHARAAVGMGALPARISVEIEMIVEIE